METNNTSVRLLAVAAAGEIVFFFLGLLTPLAVFRGVVFVEDWIEWGYLEVNVPAYLFLFILPGIGLGAAAAILIRREVLGRGEVVGSIRRSTSSALLTLIREVRSVRAVAIALLLAYLVTWSFGVPAVATATIDNDLRNAERAAEYYEEPLTRISTRVSFGVPLLPGIVLIHHGHFGGKLHGWGGWKIHFWYLTGQEQLAEVPTWLS